MGVVVDPYPSSGGSGGPPAQQLTDASVVALNVSLGSAMRLTMTSGIGATRQLGTPSNSSDGTIITILLTQDATGSQVVTYTSAYQFPTQSEFSYPAGIGGAPILSTTPGATDWLEFTYNQTINFWLLTGFQAGYNGGTTTVFFDNFTQTPNGALPDASKWSIAVGSPQSDPTTGSQWYVANTNTCSINSTAGPGGVPAMVLQVQAQGGTPLQQAGSGNNYVAAALGNYASTRLSTLPQDLAGPPSAPNIAGGQTDWATKRPGFRPMTATYGTLTVVAKFNPTAGFWPAIWLLSTGQLWPAGGEIDLIENFGGAYVAGMDIHHGYGNVIIPANVLDYVGFDWEGQNSPVFNATPAVIDDGAFHTFVCSISSDYQTINLTMDGTSYTNFPMTKTQLLAAAVTAGKPNAYWPFSASNPLGIMINCAVGSTTGPATGVGFPSGTQVLPLTVMTVSSVKFTVP